MPYISAILLIVFSLIIFISRQPFAIYPGDSGDLVTAAYVFGIAHPPGYPLWTFLTWVMTHIPLYTVAWRASLMSSIPGALSIAVIFLLIYKITKNSFSALVAGLVLIGNYIYFLYSIVPEVFSLHILFVLLIIYFLYLFSETKNNRYLYLLFFTSGLSLSNHHTVLFLAPGVIYLLGTLRKKIKLSYKNYFYILLLFCAGLLPYIYLPVSALSKPVIFWDNPSTIGGFIREVTRARYGTFFSGASFGMNMSVRLLQLKTYIRFLWADFSFFGIFLAITGLAYIIRSRKNYGVFLVISLIFYSVIYFLYASYPLAGRFTFATYERFLLSSYVLIAVLIGVGVTGLIGFVTVNVKNNLLKKLSRIIIYGMILIYVTNLLVLQYYKFRSFPNTVKTGQFVGDIFKTVDKNSILIIANDTPIFTTEYYRYAENMRPDIKLIAMSHLYNWNDAIIYDKYFPDIRFPDNRESDKMKYFLINNSSGNQIYTNISLPSIPGHSWIYDGLLYKLIPDNRLPTYDELIAENDRLWNSYTPVILKDEISKSYLHLFSAELLNHYSIASMNFAKYLVENGFGEEGLKYIDLSIAYGSDQFYLEQYRIRGSALYLLKRCNESIESFDKALAVYGAPDALIYNYKAIVYEDCLHDSASAEKMKKLYEKEANKQSKSLPQ